MYPEIEKAKGPYLIGKNGKQYINLSESINILGHRNRELMTVIHNHIRTGIVHYPLTISKPPAAEELENKLRKHTGLTDGTAVFSSSGSEACDVGLSILSDFGPVITLKGGYQGLSGQFLKKDEYDKLKYGSKFSLPFPKNRGAINELRSLINRGAKSIILEELQVEAGVKEVYDGFLNDIKESFPDLLICLDESYTGMGKTGKLFAYQWQNVVPDIVVIGKAIGGGIPLGITLVRKEIMERSYYAKKLRNNSFGSTSGNLVGLSLANHLLERVSDERFLREVRDKGEIFRSALGKRNAEIIKGRGLILGLKVDYDRIDEIISRILDEGIYVTRMNEVIRISPPLNIPQDLLKRAGKKMKNIIEKY
jgi:acetylornithine/succinyldiaminopimelate/putrescine aminotransferase